MALRKKCSGSRRHVHILDPVTREVYCPAESSPPSSPRIPSLTSSVSTAPSLPAPLTPELLYVTTPLPTFDIIIHPAIAHTGSPPALSFDLAFPPPCLFMPSHNSGASRSFEGADDIFLESATLPGRPFIKLVTAGLPWSIAVAAKSTYNLVTLYDVFEALYLSLRIQVKKAEYWYPSPAYQKEIAASYHTRVDKIPDKTMRKEQREKGVRRLDFLVGCTRFSGISTYGKDSDVFEVHWDVGGS